jgi:biopolymer transport protein ExbD
MRRHAKKSQGDAELDITSFMNLMIILVPVLLVSMVFNQVSVLPIEDELKKQELNLDDLTLEVVVRAASLSVNLGPQSVDVIPKKDGQYDYERLSQVLQRMKKILGNQRKDVAILSEPEIDYQILVSVIDHAKSFKAVVAASAVDAVLFPDVSLGDAPVGGEG